MSDSPQGLTLAGLAMQPHWVAWQQEDRKGGKPTKVPYVSAKAQAKANAGSWITRPAAEKLAATLPKPYQLGGVGLEFTILGDGRSTFGIDLDTCRNKETGALTKWAQDTIGTFNSYTEISPSYTGAKIFATYDTAALGELRKFMGTAEFSKTFARSGGDHPPAIELHLGNRYFAVTDALLDGAPRDLRHVEAATILQLLKADGPAFVGAKADREKPRSSNDQSRSAVAFRKAAQLVRAGCDFEAMVAGLEVDPETTEWMREKGHANGQRELKRLWQKTSTAIADAPRWFSKCLRSESGAPMPVLANALLALRDDPSYEALFAFDQMQRRTILSSAIPAVVLDHNECFQPRPVTDVDVTQLQERLQLSGLPRLGKDVMQQAVDARAYERGFHPVKEYLNGLDWDGTPRLATWLHRYLGAQDNEYTRGIGAKFLISMVARIEQPGCKCDYVMVFEGPQGARKSSVCRILGGEWFSDSLPDLHHSDAVRLSMHLRGKWVVEIAELSSIGKAEAGALKAFLTQTEERYTPKYARNEVIEPRQCVFIGTTNKTAYLRDETGGRRFWPVKVGKIDTDALAQDRDQLFAEALDQYQMGATWWPDSSFEANHITPEQEARYEQDAWEDAICNWLNKLHDDPALILDKRNAEARCTVLLVAQTALHMDTQKVGTADQRRIIAAMERLGWEKANRTSTGQPYKPGPIAEARKKVRDEAKERERRRDAA